MRSDMHCMTKLSTTGRVSFTLRRLCKNTSTNETRWDKPKECALCVLSYTRYTILILIK